MFQCVAERQSLSRYVCLETVVSNVIVPFQDIQIILSAVEQLQGTTLSLSTYETTLLDANGTYKIVLTVGSLIPVVVDLSRLNTVLKNSTRNRGSIRVTAVTIIVLRKKSTKTNNERGLTGLHISIIVVGATVLVGLVCGLAFKYEKCMTYHQQTREMTTVMSETTEDVT